jgi:hypothetical protein
VVNHKENLFVAMFSKNLLTSLPGNDVRICLTGPQSCGKTSLAFKLACDVAECGGCPLYICNQTKMEAKLPLSVSLYLSNERITGRVPAEVLNRVQFKYITHVAELKALLAGLHCFVPKPTFIVVDDFSSMIDPLSSISRNDTKFLEIAFTFAALLDDAINTLNAMNGINDNTGTLASLKLVLTDTCTESHYLHLLQRYIPCGVSIVPSTSTQGLFDTNGSPSFSVVRRGDVTVPANKQGNLLVSSFVCYQGSLVVTV